MTATTIQPEKILRELAELWVSFGKQEEGSEAGVLRACAMTLVVLSDAAGDPQSVSETLAELMKDHPSRAIAVRVSSGTATPFAARVFAQCWMPFGSRRQICCEQVEIVTPESELPEVPAAILPLVVADLPVILWNRMPGRLAGRAAAEFSRIATKIIVDSTTHPEPAASLEEIGQSLEAGKLIADLAWTRLTRWREIVAGIFDNPIYAARLSSVDQVRIRHTGADVPVSACYLAAWLCLCLEKTGAKPTAGFVSGSDPVVGNLCRVEMSASAGGLDISLGRVDGSAAEVRVNDLASRTVFPKPADHEQLREELSISGRDRTFESALPRALDLVRAHRK